MEHIANYEAWITVYCAQRLTASKELELEGLTSLTILCQGVLNALRHQRNWNPPEMDETDAILATCSTPYGIKGIGTHGQSQKFVMVVGAQRLTASKELEQGTYPDNRAPESCAQRLTASKELEQKSPINSLNINRSAQRLTASKELELLARNIHGSPIIPCSTPYGIKGIGTYLNPIRHRHLSCAQRLTASKELELNRVPTVSHPHSGAQRLTASKELEHGIVVCSPVGFWSAQRLTASKELEPLCCILC